MLCQYLSGWHEKRRVSKAPGTGAREVSPATGHTHGRSVEFVLRVYRKNWSGALRRWRTRRLRSRRLTGISGCGHAHAHPGGNVGRQHQRGFLRLAFIFLSGERRVAHRILDADQPSRNGNRLVALYPDAGWSGRRDCRVLQRTPRLAAGARHISARQLSCADLALPDAGGHFLPAALRSDALLFLCSFQFSAPWTLEARHEESPALAFRQSSGMGLRLHFLEFYPSSFL